MEEHIGSLIAALIIGFQVLNWIRRIANRNKPVEAEPAIVRPSPARGGIDPTLDLAGAAATRQPAGIEAAIARAVGQAAAAATRGAELVAGLPALKQTLSEVGPTGRVLIEVAETRIEPALEHAVPAARHLAQQLSSASVGEGFAMLQSGTAMAPLDVITTAERHVIVLREIARWRTDPRLGRVLADADAIAASLLDPIQRRASVQGFVFPQQRPICAPAVPNGEALWLGLLPEGYPVIFVPDDFGEDLFRQTSLPHEVGYLLWLRVPGFADEIRSATNLHTANRVLQWDGKVVRGSVSWPFGAWLPELVADGVAALMLGPAALRGLAHSFASPHNPGAVVSAHLRSDGTYDENPPAHLRIHLAAALLHRMGFDQEVKPILEEWDEAHGCPDSLVLPTQGGQRVSVPFSQLRAFGGDVMETFYTTAYTSLDGVSLQDIPGLEMSPGLWARVGRHARDLVRGEPFHEEGRVALAAAIEARALDPDQAPRIEAGLMRAVLGRDANERLAPDAHYRPGVVPRVAHSRLSHEIVDGLLLADLLTPRGRFAR